MGLEVSTKLLGVADRLDVIASTAHVALTEKLPWVIGRAAARTRLEGQLVEAVTQGRAAIAELRGVHEPIEQALTSADIAIGQLHPEWNPGIVGTGMPIPQKHALSGVHSGISAIRRHGLLLQIQDEVTRLADDPASTRAGFSSELRDLLAGPYEALSDDELYRISLLASLPDELRPSAFDSHLNKLDVLISDLGPNRWRPKTHATALALVQSLGIASDSAALAAEPGRTAASSTEDLLRAMVSPRDELDAASWRRISALAMLPEDIRPSIPAPHHESFDLTRVGQLSAHPRSIPNWNKELMRVRAHLAAGASDDVLARIVVDSRAAGKVVDDRVIGELVSRGPDVAARAGVSADEPIETTLASLDAASYGVVTGAYVRPLLAVRGHVRSLPDTPATSVIRAELLALIDRNVGRVDGIVDDGFLQHPDYADLGRITSNVRMLDQFAEVHPATTPTAEAATETVVW